MSQVIFNEVIEAILKQTDIVDVVGRYVHLTKQGHYLQGLCPFHSEKTPSFNVAPEKQIYKCFGCAAGAMQFNFLWGLKGTHNRFTEYYRLINSLVVSENVLEDTNMVVDSIFPSRP